MGINNIPPKTCTYACVYCQLGRTPHMTVDPGEFYPPDDIVLAVRERVEALEGNGTTIDYLTIVPDGEPTLDGNLGRLVDGLSELGPPTAVITNGSLLWREDVRDALQNATLVSVKVDAAEEKLWRRIDRPHGRLELGRVVDGLLAFAESFDGVLISETMLVRGLNDGEDQLAAIAELVGRLGTDTAYLSIPTRPPAEPWVEPPDELALVRGVEIVRREVDRVEHLIGYEGTEFASTGDAARDLLSITAVHPMRADAVGELLSADGADWEVVRSLVEDGGLAELDYEGDTYYVRRFARDR